MKMPGAYTNAIIRITKIGLCILLMAIIVSGIYKIAPLTVVINCKLKAPIPFKKFENVMLIMTIEMYIAMLTVIDNGMIVRFFSQI